MAKRDDMDAMMRPQDPKAEQRARSSKEPVNWAIHGGNLESVGGKPSKKKKVPTDTPPTDLPFSLPSEQSKLPPVIVSHNSDGLTTESHSANDERYSNVEAENLKGVEPSINKETPIVAGKNEENVNNQETDKAKAEASLEAYKAKETPEERAKREEMEELERLTNPNNSAPVNQSTNTSTNETPKSDPVLTTR